jgi:hypothetical protein
MIDPRAIATRAGWTDIRTKDKIKQATRSEQKPHRLQKLRGSRDGRPIRYSALAGELTASKGLLMSFGGECDECEPWPQLSSRLFTIFI